MFNKAIVAAGVLLLVILLATACSSGSPATPTVKASLPTPTLGPLLATPTPLPIPVATLSVAPGGYKVANTGGDGALLRKTPGGDVIRGWADGTVMQSAGADQQAAGRTWRNVKDPAGNVGWIAADFLSTPPAAGAAMAAPATPRPAGAATPTR